MVLKRLLYKCGDGGLEMTKFYNINKDMPDIRF